MLKYEKRKYERNLVLQLDVMDTSDPKRFWQALKTLGPKRDKDIPMKV